jgi:hypothetical protein
MVATLAAFLVHLPFIDINIDIETKTTMLAVGITLSWCAFNIWSLYLPYVLASKRSPHNFKKADDLLASRGVYAIYLRDFQSEIMPVETGLAFVRGDDVEHSLIKAIKRRVPVFALCNEMDTDWRPVALRLLCDDGSWWKMFERYAASASLVVLNIDHVSRGVEAELSWLSARQEPRVVVVATPEVMDVVTNKYPELLQRCWRISRPKRHTGTGKSGPVRMPEPLRVFLDDLSGFTESHVRRALSGWKRPLVGASFVVALYYSLVWVAISLLQVVSGTQINHRPSWIELGLIGIYFAFRFRMQPSQAAEKPSPDQA